MKYCVFGTGGVGGYFGAKLAADGNDVVFVARGAQREAMARQGLKVRSPAGDFHIEKPILHEDPRTTGLCDFVLVCTKMWDLEATADSIRPLLSHDTAVIPLQNGVSSEDILADALGPQYVMGGSAHIASRIAEPGVIEHTGTMARLTIGERDGSTSWRLEALHAACESAGIDIKISQNIAKDIWQKFLMLSPLAGATCFYRSAVGGIMADDEKRAFLKALMAETVAVAEAAGIPLAADALEQGMARLAKLPAEMKTSMLHDLEAGRRLELPWLNGEVARRGDAAALAAPANVAVTEALTPFIMGQST